MLHENNWLNKYGYVVILILVVTCKSTNRHNGCMRIRVLTKVPAAIFATRESMAVPGLKQGEHRTSRRIVAEAPEE
jgi:hypothetical protein